MTDPNIEQIQLKHDSTWDIFLIFLRLGLTSFGGPIAHLAYFRHEFVEKRQWFDEHAYADLVALCQFLPGPASSQVGIAIGLSRRGIPGAIAAFSGFTLPSAMALVLFGFALPAVGNLLGTSWLHGLKVAAVAVVAQALWGMGKTLAPDRVRASIVVAAACIVSLLPVHWEVQIGVILGGGLIGCAFLRSGKQQPSTSHTALLIPVSRISGTISLFLFFGFLFLLPVAAAMSESYAIKLVDSFYRAGALVFGGGHVVLPLLQSQVVPAGWVSNDVFLAGYGATQAVPGPLFSFAAYLGSVSSGTPSGWTGACLALTAIFLPAFLLVIGALPFWDQWRRYTLIRNAMPGINAAVVGLLLVAFYNPVWSGAIHSAADFCLASMAFLLLVFWKCPPWLVVLFTALFAGLGFY